MSSRTAPSIYPARSPSNSFTVRDALASLPRLIALWPNEVTDSRTPAGMNRLLGRLRKALRAERQRGLAGHWSYDLARHAELLAVYRTLAEAHRRHT